MARFLRADGLLNNAAWLRGGHNHQRLETDDYFSDSDDSVEDHRPMQGEPVRRVLQCKTALPQDIKFIVPREGITSEGGVDAVCIQGPHGPLRVPLPEGAKVGEECTIRLGPPAQYKVCVPEGGKVGDSVKFEGAGSEQLNAVVPEGKKPGEEFEVSLPVLLIQVPPGAKPGMEVMYEAPDRQNRGVRVPKGTPPGHYFPVLLLAPGHDVLVAEVTWPIELSFKAPDQKTIRSGQPVCLQGPHGPILVPLQEGVKPGQECQFRIGPQTGDGGYEVTVPETAKPGEAVKFQGANGEYHAVVPEGKKPGETFTATIPTIMVRVPQGAQAGQEIMFQTPGEQQVRFTKVPSGLSVGNYFPVLLQKQPEPEEGKPEQEAAKEEEEMQDAVEDADLIGSGDTKANDPTIDPVLVE